MNNSCLKYLLILNIIVAFTCPLSRLHAGQSQPAEDVAEISQLLKNFVQHADQQGLSVDQIIDQALSQGYTKEQVVSAYSALAQVGEAPSPQNTLLWCALGAAVFGIGVGVGAWVMNKWFTPEVKQPDNHVPNPRRPVRPQIINRDDLRIAPHYGGLDDDHIHEVNYIIEQGLARGDNPENIILAVRRGLPHTAFDGHFVREGRIIPFRHEPWIDTDTRVG